MYVRRGNRGMGVLFLERRRWMEVGVNATYCPLYSWGINPVPILQEVGWVPVLV
jgi:hypothetical protein